MIKKMALSSKIAIFIAIVSTGISMRSCAISNKANKIADKANTLSLKANKSSAEANKISQEAIEIAKIAESPYFKFSMSFNNNRDEILIHNEGGKLRELEEPEVYLFWTITSDKTLLDPKDMIVINYYNLGARNPLLSGKTPVSISAENPAKVESLIDGFKKLAEERGLLVFLSANWYIRLRYKDIYDEPHDDLYDVSPGGSRKMSKNEATELMKKYNQKRRQGMVIDMRTISPEILYEKWQN